MTERKYYLSYIRAFACIAIVILHTVDSAVILYQDRLTMNEMSSSLAVVYCMMWAVPCFVMVTGALLLDKKRNITISTIFKKYILRVLIALFGCCILFAAFDSLMNQDGGGIQFLAKGFVNALTGNGWAHLWYLYLLIGLYLLMIFYRAIAHHVSDREYKYLLIVYLIFLSILPVLQMWNVKAGFYIHVSTIYPFFLFAGYAIAENKLKIKTGASVLLIIVGIAGMVGSSVLANRFVNIAYGNLLSYSSIFVVALAVGVFSLFKNLRGQQIVCKEVTPTTKVYEERKPGWFGRVLLELDRCSFGIYLLHLIFTRLFLRYWQIDPYLIKPTIPVFIGIIVGVLAISFGITFLLKLIPGVKKIL